jgi:hypothetical protein
LITTVNRQIAKILFTAITPTVVAVVEALPASPFVVVVVSTFKLINLRNVWNIVPLSKHSASTNDVEYAAAAMNAAVDSVGWWCPW